MALRIRNRRGIRLPVTLSVLLISVNVVLMVCWIVLLARLGGWGLLTVGTLLFAFVLAGLVGSGRTEVARAIFGADAFDRGEVLIEGRPVRIGDPRDAIRAGIVQPSDRLCS